MASGVGALVTVVLTVGFLAVFTPPAAANRVCVVSAKLVNPCRPWIGESAANYPNIGSGVLNQFLGAEQRIGRNLDIVHTYHPVGSNTLSADDVALATRANTILFTNWKPASLWSQADGTNAGVNAAVDKMAASVKALGNHKIFMTLYHEPENDVTTDVNCPAVVYKGSAGTPAEYRAMWRATQDRFAADGVTNVVWVLDYMNYAPWDCLIPDLYPGNDLVDWIMFDGYGSTNPDWVANVSRFQDLLRADNDPDHNFVSKPWGIAEWGISGNTPAIQIAYYDQVKAALDANTFPALKAYIAYDENDQGSSSGSNLRIGYDDNGTANPVKQAHYNAFANDPLITGSFVLPGSDTTPPTVSLVVPVDGQNVHGTLPVSAQASDDGSGIASAQLIVDGQPFGSAVLDPDQPVALPLDTTTLSPGTHTVAVSVSDGSGNTATSQSVTVTVDNADHQVPSTPTGLAITQRTQTSIGLAWQPATDDIGVDGYDIMRDGNVVGQVTGADTAYLDSDLTPQTSYEYAVRARDAAGNVSPASDVVSATTLAVGDTIAPSVPTGLALEALTTTEAHLTWQPSTDDVGVAGYHVYRDGQPIATVSDGSTDYRDSGLTDATGYSYTVDSYDGDGNASALSAALQVTTPDGHAPTVPAGLAAAAISPSQVDLSWNASTDNVGVDSYVVYRDDNPIATVTGLSYSDTGLDAESEYSYQVSAVDAAGNPSPRTDPQVVTTPPAPDRTAPSVPTGLTANTLSPSSIALSWQASTDAGGMGGYYVYRNGAQVATVPTGTTYTDSGLTDGRSFSYTVAAFDAAGNTSLPSGAVTASTPDVHAPSIPIGVKVTAVAYNQVSLAWSAATDNVAVNGYHVYRGSTLIATLAGTVLTYQDKSVATKTTYTYAVDAFDSAANTSAKSSTVTATTPAAPDSTPPSTPTGLAGSLKSGAVNLTWKAATDNVKVTGYIVYRGGTKLASVTTLNYTDATVRQGSSYQYYVTAVDAAGNASGASTSVTVKVPDTVAPTAPTKLTATPGSASVKLTWVAATDNVGVTGYYVYRGTTLVGTVKTGTTFTNTGLKTGTSYTYKVVAFDAAGNKGPASSTVTVKPKATMGLLVMAV